METGAGGGETRSDALVARRAVDRRDAARAPDALVCPRGPWHEVDAGRPVRVAETDDDPPEAEQPTLHHVGRIEVHVVVGVLDLAAGLGEPALEVGDVGRDLCVSGGTIAPPS